MSVEITNIGWITLPVTIAVFALRPRWLLAWAILLTPFHAASFVNISIGDYPLGLQPGYLAAAMFVLRSMIRWFWAGRLRLPQPVTKAYLPLFLFAGLAGLGALLVPRLLEGSVLVIPPRAGVSLDNLAPLRPMGTNISQTFYLLFFTLFAFAVSVFVAQGDEARDRSMIRSYVVAALLACLTGFYQVAAWYLSLPYPVEWLYSNPTYYQGYAQTVMGLKRLSSTFTEPSVAACYFAGFVALAVVMYLTGPGRLRWLVAAAAASAAMLLTMATTAYLTLALILAGGLLFCVRHFLRRELPAAIVGAIVFGVFLCAGATVAFLARPEAAEVLDRAVQGAVSRKAETSSFADRMGADAHSYRLVLETWGLGAGWGSNRPSSLLALVFSNAGVFGFLLLAWFGVGVASLVRRAAHPMPGEQRSDLIGWSAAATAMAVACVFAVPDINILIVWISVAVVVGLAGRNLCDQSSSIAGR